MLSELPLSGCVVDVYHGETWVTNVSVVVDGSMVLPSHLFEDAVANRLRLELTVGGEVYGGYIIFLPVEESESFPVVDTYLIQDGSTATREDYLTTDFIDIAFVDDIVYQGRMSYSYGICMAGYDQDHNFVKVLIDRSATSSSIFHVEPDGSYNYVRACAVGSYDHSLQIHYRSRRRR